MEKLTRARLDDFSNCGKRPSNGEEPPGDLGKRLAKESFDRLMERRAAEFKSELMTRVFKRYLDYGKPSRIPRELHNGK